MESWLTISAILTGPIAAVQVEKFIERTKAIKERRVSIFKTLMATRGSSLSLAHVEALNRIDLEFSGPDKFKSTLEAWKEYFDSLSDPVNNENIVAWSKRKEDKLTDLLYEMGKALDFSFDKTQIRRNVYTPVGLDNLNQEEQAIRTGLIDVLEGRRVIPFSVHPDGESLQRQNELHEAMLNYYRANTDR